MRVSVDAIRTETYITAGSTRSTDLPSALQSEQLLPQRNKMSPLAAFTRHIMYHLLHRTLSAWAPFCLCLPAGGACPSCRQLPVNNRRLR